MNKLEAEELITYRKASGREFQQDSLQAVTQKRCRPILKLAEFNKWSGVDWFSPAAWCCGLHLAALSPTV